MEDKEYRRKKTPINSTLTAVQNNDYKWGAINEAGEVVIPFGKYAWIDGFQNGLAKVIGIRDATNSIVIFDDSGEPEAAQGIVNEKGEEVLPLEYYVWKFYGKDYPTIKFFKGEKEFRVSYEDLEDGDWDDDWDEDCFPCEDDYGDSDWREQSWDAMTDGHYGDMPEGFDGSFDFLGF